MTTLHVRPDDLRDAVSRFPIVKGIACAPSFPHGLRIEVVENVARRAPWTRRRPVAVAADGTLLPRRPVGGLAAVPCPRGPAGGG